jgi:hypothetical protein
VRIKSFAWAGVIIPAVLAVSAGRAEAKGVIFYGYGPDVYELGNGPTIPGVGLVKVGYLYEQFSLFWMNVWTWSGKYCLYTQTGNNIKYDEITQEMAAQFLNRNPADVSPPFGYRFPIGLLVILGITALIVAKAVLFKSASGMSEEDQRASTLMADGRYQKAVSILSGEAPEGASAGAPAAETAPDTRVRAAIDYLVGQGIPREEAEANLDLIVRRLNESAAPTA